MIEYSNEEIKLNRKHALEALRNPQLPQAFGSFFEFDGSEYATAACALGAMHLALYPECNTRDALWERADNIDQFWYNALGIDCEISYSQFANAVTTRNDDARMTLPEIADFIEERYWNE